MTHNKKFANDNIMKESDHYAVYVISNSKEILNIGEGHLQARLLKKREKIKEATLYKYELTGSKARAFQRQQALLRAYKKKHNGKLPKHNPITLRKGGTI